MLLKALKYFWFTFWGVSGRRDITRISGETYWLYRIYGEGLLVLLVCAGSFATAFSPLAGDAMATYIVAGVMSAALGLVELLRLSSRLRRQVMDAALLYD